MVKPKVQKGNVLFLCDWASLLIVLTDVLPPVSRAAFLYYLLVGHSVKKKGEGQVECISKPRITSIRVGVMGLEPNKKQFRLSDQK